MFNGVLVSATSGVSKSGKEYYRIELIADTIGGKSKVVTGFCSEQAYRHTQGIEPMAVRCKFAVGVTDTGNLTIHAVKAES